METILESTPLLETANNPLATAKRGTPARWAGRVVTGIPVAFLMFDVGIKLARLPAVAEASARLGLPENVGFGLGFLLAACLVLYLVPKVAPLGAVLLTGYLGGAVAIHLRVGDPVFSHTLFPVYVGAMLWVGLFLRDPRVRSMIGGAR